MKSLALVFLCMAAIAAAKQMQGGAERSWGICSLLDYALKKGEAQAQNETLAACYKYQPKYLQSCKAGNVSAEAAGLAGLACAKVCGYLAAHVPLIGRPLFNVPNSPGYKLCAASLQKPIVLAINKVCKNSGMDAKAVCDIVFCDAWQESLTTITQKTGCKNLPVPSLCDH